MDPEFEEDVNTFVDAVLAEEKRTFQPGIESFQVHANRIRQNLKLAMQEFQTNFVHGYQTICQGLEARGIEKPKVDEVALAIFENPDELLDALESGRQIYELLGFSLEQLMQFYEIGIGLVEANEAKKARDVFSFLATIASEISAFWLGLGRSSADLGNFDQSLDAYTQAVELNPRNSDAYLGCLHVYIKTQRADDALKLCDQGLDFAASHGADELHHTLTEAKQYITATHITHH